MTHRTVTARARLHIELGLAKYHRFMQENPELRQAWDYKDCASEQAHRILKSAQGDKKAYAFLLGVGVWPDAPRSTMEAIQKLKKEQA